jgi:hypothetical protein
MYNLKGVSNDNVVRLPFNRETDVKSYDEMLSRLLNYSSEEWRFLLDNLDYIPTFRVYWLSYRDGFGASYPKNAPKTPSKPKAL